MSALFCPGMGASEVLPVYGRWPVTSWSEYPTAVHAMARGLRSPIRGRGWTALTTSAAVFHSSTLLGVSRAKSYGPQVLLCHTLRYSSVWHQVSLFLSCPFPALGLSACCRAHSGCWGVLAGGPGVACPSGCLWEGSRTCPKLQEATWGIAAATLYICLPCHDCRIGGAAGVPSALQHEHH